MNSLALKTLSNEIKSENNRKGHVPEAHVGSEEFMNILKRESLSKARKKDFSSFNNTSSPKDSLFIRENIFRESGINNEKTKNRNKVLSERYHDINQYDIKVEKDFPFTSQEKIESFQKKNIVKNLRSSLDRNNSYLKLLPRDTEDNILSIKNKSQNRREIDSKLDVFPENELEQKISIDKPLRTSSRKKNNITNLNKDLMSPHDLRKNTKKSNIMIDRNSVSPDDLRVEFKRNIKSNPYKKNIELVENRFIRPKSVRGQQREFQVESNGEYRSLLSDRHVETIMMNQNNEQSDLLSSNQVEVKILDLSKIGTGNTKDIFNMISNYISQNTIGNRKEIEVVVKHGELGNFKILAQKVNNREEIDLKIMTHTDKGKDFFVNNEIELIKKLGEAGVQLSDLKIISSGDNIRKFVVDDKGYLKESGELSSQSFNDSGNNDESYQFSKQENNDSKRRQRLWEEYRERAMSA